MTATAGETSGRVRARRNRSQDVIEAAICVFQKKGYASASIQDVADEVGVLKGSLYHYIDSKEDLLARIFDENADSFEEMLGEADGPEATATERLRTFARNCTLWYLRNIERVKVYVDEWEHLSGKRLKEVKRIRTAYEHRVGGLIGDVKEAGEGAPDLDVKYATYFIFGALNGLPTWYRSRGSDSAERIADAYADLIVATVADRGTRG